jgi:hypothetical protein
VLDPIATLADPADISEAAFIVTPLAESEYIIHVGAEVGQVLGALVSVPNEPPDAINPNTI